MSRDCRLVQVYIAPNGQAYTLKGGKTVYGPWRGWSKKPERKEVAQEAAMFGLGALKTILSSI